MDRKIYNEWWINLETKKRFELMKKYDFKNPNDKVLCRIYKLENDEKTI